MSFYIESIKFNKYTGPFNEFRSSRNQAIGRDLYRRGTQLRALARGTVPKNTGRLSSSIYVEFKRAGLNPKVIVGSRVNYALYVHEGTKPHMIRPKKAGRSLRFVYNGRVVYARKVNHPGTRATRYLSRHLRQVVR